MFVFPFLALYIFFPAVEQNDMLLRPVDGVRVLVAKLLSGGVIFGQILVQGVGSFHCFYNYKSFTTNREKKSCSWIINVI